MHQHLRHQISFSKSTGEYIQIAYFFGIIVDILLYFSINLKVCFRTTELKTKTS